MKVGMFNLLKPCGGVIEDLTSYGVHKTVIDNELYDCHVDTPNQYITYSKFCELYPVEDYYLDKYQGAFTTNLRELINADEDNLDYIEQCHFGDLLIEKTDLPGYRWRLWKKLKTNGGGILIEYCGDRNRYVWDTVFETGNCVI